MNHQDGFWLCNLWYFELIVSVAATRIVSTGDTLEMGMDHFTAVAHHFKKRSQSARYTLLTLGWYVNNENGKLSLTHPQSSILLMED